MAQRGIKAFTTWDYESREGNLKVPVFLVDENKVAGYHRFAPSLGRQGPSTYFEVKLNDPEINEFDTDIDRLRKTVFEQIKKKLAVEWKSWLVVQVRGSRTRLFSKKSAPSTPDTEQHADVSISVHWNRVQTAVIGGKKVHRVFSSYYKPHFFGHESAEKRDREQPRETWSRILDGLPDLKEDKGFDSSRSSYFKTVMIDDTPANRVALEAIADGVDQVYAKLNKLFGSGQIEQLLASLAGGGLLSLPSPAKSKKGKA